MIHAPPGSAQALLREVLDLPRYIESSLRVADLDARPAVARLGEDCLGVDAGDHSPKTLESITELRDRIYTQINRADLTGAAPS